MRLLILLTKKTETFAETEKKLLLRAIESNGGKNAEAIKMLGISKTAFYEKIKKYNL